MKLSHLSLRELFLLVAFVAMACGCCEQWWNETRVTAAEKSPDDKGLTAYLKKNRADEEADALFRNLVLDREYAFQGKSLAFACTYTNAAGDVRHVFLYDPNLQSWPGEQLQTIVIADEEQRLITWKEYGGSAMFVEAAIDDPKCDTPALLVTRKHRHATRQPNGAFSRVSVTRVSLDQDRITETDVQWLPITQPRKGKD